MAKDVKLNYKTVGRYLNGEFGVKALMRGEAEKVLSRARSSAPVVSGAYKASLHITTTKHDRLVTRVVASVPYAVDVEARHGTLSQALG